MDIKKIGNLTVVKVLIFIHLNGSVRHRDIAKIVLSRGSLSLTLNSLLREKLITREVNVLHAPAQTYYSITEKGREVARRFKEIVHILED